MNLAHFSKELEKQDSEKNKNVKAKKKRKPELRAQSVDQFYSRENWRVIKMGFKSLGWRFKEHHVHLVDQKPTLFIGHAVPIISTMKMNA